MADFKTALDALVNGNLRLESLSKQIDNLLKKSPVFANKMLAQLDEVYEQKKLDDQTYSHLKRQINEFRRTHASATESGDAPASVDATVFAKDDIIASAATTNGFSEEDATVKSDATANTDDPTAVMSDAGKPAGTGTTSSNFLDISASDSNTPTPSVTPATSAGWEQPDDPVSDLTGNYREGSIIKHRFKLEKVLGIGGMGKVYKALDLLKAEAKDKKPYVAIKLLNEDFKNHPEAFISLQRESSRQQKLAHPNIATIYDFDRVGGPGTPIFITMELMEGMELKDYIKKKARPKGGVPFKEAYDIIRQLGAGLIYAHERNLVHSDFKPGNAFLCNNGMVKTLDFGIARAVKNPVTGETEKTLFDPGKLGALTPAYASMEMLNGQDPDTRDDIYALGCTSYELLTGKHPFGKLPANKAMEQKLVPPYVKSLNKKQNRALRRSVAFSREDRSPNVRHFMDELKGRATWHKNPLFIAAVVLVIIGAILFAPAMDYLNQRKLDAIIAEIQQGTEQVIAAKLNEIQLLKKVDRATVANEAKDAIMIFFSGEVENALTAAEKSYDYSIPESILKEIGEFYPESIYLQEETEQINDSKKRIVSNLTSKYVAALNDESLIGDINSILDNIGKVDPTSPLLKDTSPVNAYRLLALQKLDANDTDAALALIDSGIKFSGGNDQRLIDLREKIERTRTIAALENELGNMQGQLVSLSDFKLQEESIIQLASLKPDSKLITALAARFKPVIDTELASIQKSGTRDDADMLASEFGNLIGSLRLNRELSQIKLAKLTGNARKQKVTELANDSIANMEAALADTQPDDYQWETNILKDFQQLESLVSEGKGIAPKLDQYRNHIADVYITKAQEALQSGRFDAADNYITHGERFAPGLEELAAMHNDIASAAEESDRLARIEANKLPFQSLTDGDNVAEAEKIFAQFKAGLPADNLYLTTEAAPMLADAYGRLAKTKAEVMDFAAANDLVSRGIEIDPGNIELNDLKTTYQSEENIIELSALFKTAVSFPNYVKKKVSQIASADPVRFAEFSNSSSSILVKRINDLRERNENAAASMANMAASLFPSSPKLAELKQQLQLKPWGQFANAIAAINSGKLTQATKIQQEAASKFAGHPQFAQFSESLERRTKALTEEFNDYLKDKEAAGEDYDELRLAKRLLQRVRQKWIDSEDFAAAEKELDVLIAKVKPVQQPRIRTIERSLDEIAATTGAGTAAATTHKKWSPIASNSKCTRRLAGYGTRAKAICYDMIHEHARGPLMVVLPNGEGFNKPFAIGKYEISVGDYSKYCIISGACQPIKDNERRNEPMTGITLQQAKAYAAWLSERTGNHYRLPTNAEWEYAANAGGRQPKKDFNCRVSVGEKLIKGTGIVSVKSGKSNGWGLKNYVGNVQEWVMDGKNIIARGGAFSDTYSKCDIGLARVHDGGADETTGFRLVMDSVG